MSQLTINIGQSANDRSGDPLRTAFTKVNANFTELYTAMNADVQIPTQSGNGGKYLTTNGTNLSWGTISSTTNHLVNGNYSLTLGADGSLTFPGGAAFSSGTDLIAKDDGTYIELGSHNQQTWIGAENNDAFIQTSYGNKNWQWTFDSNANLTVPGNITFPQGKLGVPNVNGTTDAIRFYDFGNEGTQYNYSMGAEGSHIWFNVDQVSDTQGFKFYGGGTLAAKITTAGNLYISGIKFPDSSTQTTAWTGILPSPTYSGSNNIGNVTPAALNLNNTGSPGQVKTQLTLINTAGNANTGSAIDFFTYTEAGNGLPGARIQSIDDGNFSSNFSIALKASGNDGNGSLSTQWTFGSDGKLKLPGTLWAQASDNGSIVFSDDGSTDHGSLKVDGGHNMLLSSESNFYIKRAGQDRLAITDTTSTLMASTDLILKSNKNATEKVWTFGADGSLTFPNNSVQTTAWTGSTSTLVNGSYKVSLNSSGSLTIPSSIDGNMPATGHLITVASTWDGQTTGIGNDSNGILIADNSTNELITTGWTMTSADNTVYTVTNAFPIGPGYSVVFTPGVSGYKAGNSFWPLTFTSPDYAPASSHDISITTNSKTWTFTTSGYTTLPGQVNLSGGIVWTNGNEAAINYTGGYFVIGTKQLNSGPTWKFNDSGSLTFPDNSSQTTAYLGTATTSQIGGVQPDGTSITISNGVISSASAFQPNGVFNIVTANTTTVLTNATAQNITLTGSATQTIQLPDATTLKAGWIYRINNNSSSASSITVNNNGGSQVGTVPQGGDTQVILLDNSTTNGSWDYHGWIPSNLIMSSSVFQLGSSAYTIGPYNSTLTLGTSTGGTTYNFGTGATLSGNTKTINIGTGGVSGSTTTITVGSASGTSTTAFNGTTTFNAAVKLNGVTTTGIVATAQTAGTVASAATIAPTNPITFVSGNTQITTITPPSGIATYGGQITLIPIGTWTTATGGNIALATTTVTNKALIMTYDAGTSKWYPSY